MYPVSEEVADSLPYEDVILIGPENRQGLKKELWTRIIRIGEEFRGETRLQPILDDMLSFHESPPDAARATSIDLPSGKTPWALLFDPKVCDVTHADRDLEEMEL